MPKIPGWSKISKDKWRNDEGSKVLTIYQWSKTKWGFRVVGDGSFFDPWFFSNKEEVREKAVDWMRKHPKGGE